MRKAISRTLACMSLPVLNQCETREIHDTHGAVFRETLVQTLLKATTVRIEKHSSSVDVAQVCNLKVE